MRLDPRSLRRRVLAACIASEALLVVADYSINYREVATSGAIRRLFNITREDSLASFFGTTQTILLALTLWAVFALVGRADLQQRATRWSGIGWLVLAAAFTYIAIDDGAMVHERLGTAFEQMADDSGSTGISGTLLGLSPSYPWQVLFLPAFGALGVFVVVFLWNVLDRHRDRWLVVAAVACLVAAVALDFIEGLDPDHTLNVYGRIAASYDLDTYTEEVFGASGFETLVHFSKSVEETLEMLAITLLWVVALGYLLREVQAVRILPPSITMGAHMKSAGRESARRSARQP